MSRQFSFPRFHFPRQIISDICRDTPSIKTRQIFLVVGTYPDNKKPGNFFCLDLQRLTKWMSSHTYPYLFYTLSIQILHRWLVISINYILEILDNNLTLCRNDFCRDPRWLPASFWPCLETANFCCRDNPRQLNNVVANYLDII